jgi:hypothetical protein
MTNEAIKEKFEEIEEASEITAVRLWVAQQWIMPLVIGTYE